MLDDHEHECGVCRSEGHVEGIDGQKAYWDALSWSFIIMGALLRVAHWLGNRSLWLDEAKLARNIIDRSPLELLFPLHYSQGAPILFLWLVDAATALFGSGELALRLIPLLSSLLGLVLFFFVARLFLEARYVPIAVLLFALSYRLTYYAQEIKQYSVDVTVAIALTYSFLRFWKSGSPRDVHLIRLGVLGAMAIFLSYPSVVVLAGIASTLIALKCCKQLGVSSRTLIPVILSWVVGFGANYIFFLQPLAANEASFTYWRGGFLPLPISTGAVKAWWKVAGDFLLYCGFPLQWHVLVVALAAVAVGSGIRSKSVPMLMIAMCFCCACGVSVLEKYPFADRLALYAMPLLVLAVVQGLQVVSHQRSAMVYFILTLAVIAPCMKSLPDLLRPIQIEEVKPLLAYLDLNRRPGDHVYVYCGALQVVKYCRRNEAAESEFWHFGRYSRDDHTGYLDDISTMRKWTRVWFLFAHDRDEERFFVSHIDGILLEKHKKIGASLYLYCFRQPGPDKAMDGD